MAIQNVSDAYITPQTDGDTYNGDASDQTYSINPNLLTAGENVVIIDQGGNNKIELLGGLEITSSIVTADETLITLSNGATINIRGANTFTFEVGQNLGAGDTTGTTKTFAEFSLDVLGVTPPAEGEDPVNGGASTINDDGTANPVGVGPSLSIADVSVNEADGTATFTVTLSGDAPSAGEQVTVDYATSGVTASEGSDYTAASGTLTFAEGESQKTISVSVSDDSDDEDNETFSVTLSNVAGSVGGTDVAIGDSSATGTIVDNDDAPVQGQVIELSNGIDYKDGTEGDDIFDGLVNEQGTPTLNSSDRLDGKGGSDKLVAELNAAGTTSTTTTNIETLELIATAGATFDLINTSGVENVYVKNGTAALTLNNIMSTGLGITQLNQAGDYNLNFSNSALEGSNTVSITLNGAQSDGGGGADVAIAQQAGTNTTGAETVVLDSIGTNSNFLESITSVNAAANSTITSLMVTGGQDLTITDALNASVVTGDASGLTGGLSAGFANAGSNMTLKGGSGNDTFTLANNAGIVTADMGTGDDFLGITAAGGLLTTDVLAGGEGTDTLSVNSAAGEAVTASLTNVTGFETLQFFDTTTAGATANATFFGDIGTVDFNAGTGAGTFGLTLAAGTKTVTLDNTALGGALTIGDTGTATDDILNLTNVETTAVDMFNGKALNINGFETVNLNTGNTASAAQTTGTIALAGDSTTGQNTLNIMGANQVTVGGLTSNSSGVLTVDASGMTGTGRLIMGGAPTFTGGVLGTVNITGSDNNNAAGTAGDTILGHASQANTINAGAGIDTVTGGSGVDTIDLGAGNDILNASTGNDTIVGGDGNDTITAGVGEQNIDAGTGNDTVNMDATLSASDVVKGGDGTDVFAIDALATAGTAAGVSGFETLRVDTAGLGNHDMIQFTANSTFTTLAANANGVVAFTNVGAGVSTLSLLSTGGATATASVARLVDTASDTLTINGDDSTANVSDGATAYLSVTANNEETLNINSGSDAAEDLTIATLNASDLTTLTLGGTGDVIITNAIAGAANLATVNGAGVTGAVTVDASNSTADMTLTGSLTGANSLTGGTGADTITGGSIADTLLSGGNGADIINAGSGNDADIRGGIGADTIDGGIGDDTMAGGADNDTLTGGIGADVFVFDNVNGKDTITDFVVGTDTINTQAAIGSTALLDAAVGAGVTIAAAQAGNVVLVNNQAYYVSMNGAAANLTTGGTATLTTADLTATTLTNVATYLDEQFNAANAADEEAIIVVNWTAGGSTKSYIYDFVDAGGDAAVDAAELTLIGVVERGTTVMAIGDLV